MASCEICGVSFSTKRSVMRHVKEKHHRDERFTCSICYKSFSRRGTLLKHNELLHEPDNAARNKTEWIQKDVQEKQHSYDRESDDGLENILHVYKNEKCAKITNTFQNENIDISLQHPMNGIVAGATQSGKSFFVAKLIKFHKECIVPPPSRIIWCYTEYQPKLFRSVLEHTPTVEFREGLLDVSCLNPSQTNLVVLDDLLCEIANNKEVTNLFIRGSHHRNTSVLILMQNLYYPGKEIRTLNLNAHYLVLFKTPRDRSAIMHLARQISPTNTNYVIDAFNQAVTPPYGYLFVDLKPNTLEKYRLRTGILPDEEAAVFIQK